MQSIDYEHPLIDTWVSYMRRSDMEPCGWQSRAATKFTVIRNRTSSHTLLNALVHRQSPYYYLLFLTSPIPPRTLLLIYISETAGIYAQDLANYTGLQRLRVPGQPGHYVTLLSLDNGDVRRQLSRP